jgi:2'-5' RNA ligase
MTGTFGELFTAVTAGHGRFGHREHVHLTWLAIRRTDPATAVELVSDGIQRTARYAGQPRKYHVTMSRAWVELIAARMSAADPDFATFAARHPEVLDKRLLNEHYRPGTLATEAARTDWVPPDAKPFEDSD